ncbi:MAG: nucleoside phosphorylase [Deltaproteobacteria bacterium]|nr:nucleoside phosphorylase [Deltaproteobacteria bacterium]
MHGAIDPHHILLTPDQVAGNQGRGRFFLLPGSPTRAQELSEMFTEVTEVVHNPRGHTAYLGVLDVDGERLDVASIATGMGTPSVGIIVTELLAQGATRLLRVGTSGSIQPEVKLGDLVIATGAVRDEATSDAWLPREFPAVAHQDWIEALSRAAIGLDLGQHAFAGVVHTKDAFYGREFPMGPLKAQNQAYMETLAAAGVLASEMESSHLFVLGQVHGRNAVPVGAPTASPNTVKMGAVFAVVGTLDGLGPADARKAAEARMCEVGVRSLVELARMERR